jgi:hypothetical protein
MPWRACVKGGAGVDQSGICCQGEVKYSDAQASHILKAIAGASLKIVASLLFFIYPWPGADRPADFPRSVTI